MCQCECNKIMERVAAALEKIAEATEAHKEVMVKHSAFFREQHLARSEANDAEAPVSPRARKKKTDEATPAPVAAEPVAVEVKPTPVPAPVAVEVKPTPAPVVVDELEELSSPAMLSAAEVRAMAIKFKGDAPENGATLAKIFKTIAGTPVFKDITDPVKLNAIGEAIIAAQGK